MDWFGPDVRTSDAKVGCHSSVAFVVGIVLSLLESFGFFVALQLFSQCAGKSLTQLFLWHCEHLAIFVPTAAEKQPKRVPTTLP